MNRAGVLVPLVALASKCWSGSSSDERRQKALLWFNDLPSPMRLWFIQNAHQLVVCPTPQGTFIDSLDATTRLVMLDVVAHVWDMLPRACQVEFCASGKCYSTSEAVISFCHAHMPVDVDMEDEAEREEKRRKVSQKEENYSQVLISSPSLSCGSIDDDKDDDDGAKVNTDHRDENNENDYHAIIQDLASMSTTNNTGGPSQRSAWVLGVDQVAALTLEDGPAQLAKLMVTQNDDVLLLLFRACGVSVDTALLSTRAYGNLVKELLVSRVEALKKPASRVLLSTILDCCCKGYPGAMVTSLLVPLTHSLSLGGPQAEVVCRCLEALDEDYIKLYCKMLWSSSPDDKKWTEHTITVIQKLFLLPISPMAHEDVSPCLLHLQKQAAAFADNIKFGKLLLTLVNKQATTFQAPQVELCKAVASHLTSFIGKTVKDKLAKL